MATSALTKSVKDFVFEWEGKDRNGKVVRGESRGQGFGLGLAIVSTIAEGVGTELRLASPASGRLDGFEGSVQFVATPPRKSDRATSE